ncbi:hypothetical protein FOL47_004086, partial [Perkinsus chesapeaki]
PCTRGIGYLLFWDALKVHVKWATSACMTHFSPPFVFRTVGRVCPSDSPTSPPESGTTIDGSGTFLGRLGGLYDAVTFEKLTISGMNERSSILRGKIFHAVLREAPGLEFRGDCIRVCVGSADVNRFQGVSSDKYMGHTITS